MFDLIKHTSVFKQVYMFVFTIQQDVCFKCGHDPIFSRCKICNNTM